MDSLDTHDAYEAWERYERSCNTNVDAMVAKMGKTRGPAPGEGRSHGRPWRGLVEDTTHIWVTWFVQAAKAAGKPVPAALLIDGVRVPFVSVELTFGKRWYFQAPCCNRRVEALYFLGREWGCRKCLRLGYKSQVTRPTSVWRFLDDVFDRRSLWKRLFRRYEEDDNPVVAEAVEPARRLLAQSIEAMMERIEAVGDEQDE